MTPSGVEMIGGRMRADKCAICYEMHMHRHVRNLSDEANAAWCSKLSIAAKNRMTIVCARWRTRQLMQTAVSVTL